MLPPGELKRQFSLWSEADISHLGKNSHYFSEICEARRRQGRFRELDHVPGNNRPHREHAPVAGFRLNYVVIVHVQHEVNMKRALSGGRRDCAGTEILAGEILRREWQAQKSDTSRWVRDFA